MIRAVVVAAVVSGLAACSASPRIRLVQDVPAEVSTIVETTWQDFEEHLPWAAECMLPVELILTRSVPDGAARYRATEQLIEVEIPTSPARFRESVVHEIGHHIDATCEGIDQLRRDFISAQGLDPQLPWDDAETWEATPAEHFAEAIVAIVTGDRLQHEDRIAISDRSLDVVRAAGGASSAVPEAQG